jgi:hypothetical protein
MTTNQKAVIIFELTMRPHMRRAGKKLNDVSRTAVEGEKQVIPVHESRYDIRVLIAAAKTLYSGRPLPGEYVMHKLLSGTMLEKLL